MMETGRFLPMETVTAIMTFTLAWAAGAGVALAARAAALRWRRTKPERAGRVCGLRPPDEAGGGEIGGSGEVGDVGDVGENGPAGESGLMRSFSWFLFVSPAAPVAAFVTLFEIEAARTFLSGGAADPDGLGGLAGNPLTGVLVWPAFLFVGFALLAAVLLLCRRLHRRLGGRNAGRYGLVLFAGLAAAGVARLLA